MPLTPPATMAAFVCRRVSALLDAPDAWGSPEAVELQLLLLLEMWHVASGAPRNEIDGVSARYDSYLGRVLPGPPVSLAARLKLETNANERFVNVLQDFAAGELVSRRAERVLRVAQAPWLPRSDWRSPLHPKA